MHPQAHFIVVNSATQSSPVRAPDTPRRAAVGSCGNMWWVLAAPGRRDYGVPRTCQGRQAHGQAGNSQGAGIQLASPKFWVFGATPPSSFFLIYPTVGSVLQVQHGAPLLPLQNEEASSPWFVLTWKSYHGDFNALFLNDPGSWPTFCKSHQSEYSRESRTTHS